MLGRFLEIAVLTDRPQDAWEMFQQLGFAPAVTGDIWTHDYGVVCCAGLALGWHAAGNEQVSLCTVRPNVLALQRELETMGIEIESAQLGPDVFNQLFLREPAGMAIRVLEARSFTPPEIPGRTRLGRFEALSLPVGDVDTATGFWRGLGYAARESNIPWGGMEIDGLPLAYHTSGHCPEPLLVFHRDAQGLDPKPLLACGLGRGRTLPALPASEHLLLRAPGEIGLLLLA